MRAMSANAHIDYLLQAASRKHTDELRLRAGQPPMVYSDNNFRKVNAQPVTAEQLASLIKSMAPNDAQALIAAKGESKFYFDFGNRRFFALAAQSDQALDLRIRRCH